MSGRARAGCGTQEHHAQWCNTDACGVVCATVVWIIALGASAVLQRTTIAVVWGWSVPGVLASLLLLALNVLCLSCHAKAMLSNPGAVPFAAKPVNPEHYKRHCSKCNHFKPLRAHHCSVCNRCVIKMDHHCPWINNCVGISSHKFFILFVLYNCSLCVMGLVMLAIRFFHCMDVACDTTAGDAVGMLMVGIVCALFGLFTGCLLVDQLTVITTGQTQIDRMKGTASDHYLHAETDNRKMVWHNLSEVFGGDASVTGVKLTWFLPTPVVFHNPEALTGFCFRDIPLPRTDAELESI